MKKILLSLAASMVFLACNMQSSNHEQEIKQMEDSVFASLPTVNGVSIEISENFHKELRVTLRDKELYNAVEAERTKAVERIEGITEKVFKEKMPEKAEVIFVEEENTIHAKEGSEKVYPLKLK